MWTLVITNLTVHGVVMSTERYTFPQYTFPTEQSCIVEARKHMGKYINTECEPPK